MKKTLLLAGVAAALFTFNASATEIKPYVGLDYIYSNADLDDGTGYFENKLDSFDINIGAKLHQNFGLEAFYQKSKEAKGATVTNPLTGNTGRTKTSFDAYGVDLVGYMPINEKVEFLATLGLGQYDAEVKIPDLTESEDGLGIRLGIGAQYNINEHFSLRGLVRYVDTDIDNINHITELSAGIRYNF